MANLSKHQKAQIWAAAQYLQDTQKAGATLRFMQAFPEVFTPPAIQEFCELIRERGHSLLKTAEQAIGEQE